MTASVKDMLSAANDAAPPIAPGEARRLIADEGALLVDVRDGTEVAQTGRLKGALHVSRGLLEFRADLDAPTRDPAFRRDRPVILYCASGGRSTLAGQTLKSMGYQRVHNLGGFKDAVAGGLETES